jgi:galactokinase
VLPVAIPYAAYIAAAPSEDGWVRIFSEEKQCGTQFRVDAIADAKPRDDWSDYVIGVAVQLARAGVEIRGLNLYLTSEVPEGAGLSSSAALEVVTAMALLDGRQFDSRQIARVCRQAEIEFAGVPVGIMDQFVSVFGKANAAVLIDCRAETHQNVGLPRGLEVVAIDTCVKHALGSSAYRERVNECAAAVRFIQQKHPQVESLRDATPEMAEEIPDEVVRRRARHVTTENQRVIDFVAAAHHGELSKMGKLAVASHISLRDDYEVSCPELDILVKLATEVPGVYGARLTGAGFGGCTVNLASQGAVQQLAEHVSEGYKRETGRECRVYRAHPSDGAGEFS